jgi:hypothetical protein
LEVLAFLFLAKAKIRLLLKVLPIKKALLQSPKINPVSYS